jgi:hypothetical protein
MSLLQQETLPEHAGTQQVGNELPQHLVVPILVSIVAWKVLVPFTVSVTGKLTAELIKERYFDHKSAQDLQQIVHSTVGDPVLPMTPEQRERCVAAIQEALKPRIVQKEQAGRIVDALLRETNRT